MAAYLSYVVGAAKSYIWQAKVPESIIDDFNANLIRFSWTSLTQQGCINNCIESIKKALQPSDYELLDAGKQTIDAHIDNFRKAVDNVSGIKDRDAVKTAFRSSLTQMVMEKWAAAVAKSFYPIPSITDEKERAEAAQKWTHQLYDGIDYLAKCADQSGSSPTYLQTIQDAIVGELSIHYHNQIQSRAANMMKRYEKNPDAFAKEMENSFNEKDPNNEYVKLMEDSVNGVLLFFPALDQNCALMKKCFWYGNTLREAKISILDPGPSLTLFKGAFAKKE